MMRGAIVINMDYICSFFHGIFLKENTEGLKKKKFMHNNLCILALAVYLSLEQLYYGFYTTQSGELIHEIHFGTALVMGLYAIVSGYFHIKKVNHIGWSHEIYAISFGFFGFVIAITRALLIQNDIFALPSVYIAVLYGFAVFFYFSPIVSFGIYSLTSASIIILLPMFQHEVVRMAYAQDILSNNIIAWIASVINYHRYVREYRSQQVMCNKNELLEAKTYKIEKTNQVLQYISNVDALTNIYNRRKLNELLDMEYDRCTLLNRRISLILMDVDLFKSINDTYGHAVGDKVLAKLGDILKSNISRGDKAGRWGGEEFLIICPERDFEDALNLAERIRKMIQSFDFNLRKNVTCSFGVATNKEIDTIANLTLRADQGLYKAKKMGRNRVEGLE